MTTIIKIDDIAKYFPMAEGIKLERIEPYIKQAETIDLESALGCTMFNDFMNNISSTKYQELLNGKVYNVNGIDINYEGLIPMLAYYSLARYAPYSAASATAFGWTRKKTDQSEHLSGSELANMASDFRSIAIAYQEKVRLFMQANPITYTLYNGYGEGLNSNSVKFFDL